MSPLGVGNDTDATPPAADGSLDDSRATQLPSASSERGAAGAGGTDDDSLTFSPLFHGLAGDADVTVATDAALLDASRVSARILDDEGSASFTSARSADDVEKWEGGASAWSAISSSASPAAAPAAPPPAGALGLDALMQQVAGADADAAFLTVPPAPSPHTDGTPMAAVAQQSPAAAPPALRLMAAAPTPGAPPPPRGIAAAAENGGGGSPREDDTGASSASAAATTASGSFAISLTAALDARAAVAGGGASTGGAPLFFGGSRERARAAGLPSPKPLGILKRATSAPKAPAGEDEYVGAGAGVDADASQGLDAIAPPRKAARKAVAIISPPGHVAESENVGVVDGDRAAVGAGAGAGGASEVVSAPAPLGIRSSNLKATSVAAISALSGVKRPAMHGDAGGSSGGIGAGGVKRVKSGSSTCVGRMLLWCAKCCSLSHPTHPPLLFHNPLPHPHAVRVRRESSLGARRQQRRRSRRRRVPRGQRGA